MSVYVRWIVKKDLSEVYRIGSDSFDAPLDQYDICQMLRQRQNVGMVADDGDVIKGFIVYRVLPSTRRMRILELVVAKEYRRQGVGSAMLAKVLQKNRAVYATMNESNLYAQLMFQKCGFSCRKILRDYYGDSDAYWMERKCQVVTGE